MNIRNCRDDDRQWPVSPVPVCHHRGMAAFLAIAGPVVLILGGAVVVAARRVGGHTAAGVMRRLTPTGAHYSVHLRTYDQLWNPASRPCKHPVIQGPGQASYWLDEQGLVHLNWEPTKRAAQHFTGPVPEVAIPGTAAYARRRQLLRTIVIVLCAYPAAAAAGFAAGYLLTTGPDHHRAAVGGSCAIGGFLAAWLIGRGALLVETAPATHKRRASDHGKVTHAFAARTVFEARMGPVGEVSKLKPHIA